MVSRSLGDVRITRLVETVWQASTDLFFTHEDRIRMDALDTGDAIWSGYSKGILNVPIQCYLVETPNSVTLIDTGIGSNKHLPRSPQWDRAINTALIDALSAEDLNVSDIDLVICTHLHTDHCGWNTVEIDGIWRPTFPKAEYLFCDVEFDHARRINNEVFQQNVKPVVDAGQHIIVDSCHIVDEYIRLAPSPGHSPGHVCVHLASGSQRAIIIGDIMHSPLQCLDPTIECKFDFDRSLATQTRKQLLRDLADSNALVITSHFPFPSAGYICRSKSGYDFQYDQIVW